MIPNQPSSQRTNNHLSHGAHSPDANPRRIKLTSVHSLKKSPQTRLLSPNTAPSPSMQPYHRLFYHSNVFGQGESRTAFLAFESVVEAVESIERVEGVESARELESKGAYNGKQRCLVLTSTNDKSIKLVEAVAKKKSKLVDLILLGELRPSVQYLSVSVVLVTSDPKQVTAFLRQSGFATAPLQAYQRRSSMDASLNSSGLRTAMGNRMRESEDSLHSPIVARRSNPIKEKIAHHWMVDKTANGSFATTEISGEKAPPEVTHLQKRRSQEGEESQVREYDERELRGEVPKAEQKNWKAEAEATLPREVQPPKKMATSSDNYGMNPRVYRHFPSNIITEVSDQYKGSVRESIMNIEPDLSFKSTRRFPSNLVTHTIADPSEDAARRAISGLNVNEYRKVESMVNHSQGSSYTTGTTMRHGSAYLPQTNARTGEMEQQQPATRVIGRKDVISPEEANAANIVNRVPPSTTAASSTPTPIRQQSATQLVSQQYVPATYRAINSSKVSEIISSPALSRPSYSSPIDQLRSINHPPSSPQQAFTSPNRQMKVTTYASNTINWDDYDKIESDGRTIYRKKVSTTPTVVASLPVQVTRQAVEAKTVQESKQEPPTTKATEQAQLTPKIEENKASKAVVSPRKSPPSQPANSPNILMLQSTLKPSPPPPPPPIPTVKVSAPVPQKQQSTKFTQLPKTPSKKVVLQPKLKQANKNGAKALMNESMFSRMSELHSDGSILRRNNIRFGVKPPQPQQPQREVRYEPSMLQSKLSGIYKAGAGDARKNTLTRAIVGEEELEEERVRLGHVITRFNCFHFIVQEELGYLAGTIEAHVATPNDRLETFTGMEQLYERIRSDRVEGRFDAGFIFARKQEAQLVNPSLLPEDYYMVTIERGEGDAFLEVEEAGRRVRMDQLGRLLLAQRLVVDSKLYQYVAYRSHLRQIGLLADRFLHTEFILEQVETEFTSEILDFYYCQLPRLTRLYLLCDQQQLGKLVRLVGVYAQLNPSFSADSCKIICILTGILTNEALIMTHPTVTFINNPEDIHSYQDVLRYAHHAEEDHRRTLPTDRLFFHRALTGLETTLEQRFPGRFLAVGFSKLGEVYARLDKLGKGRGGGERNYLVLHESLSHQRVAVQRFARSFMVGKAKAVQPLVARVLNYEELLEVLGK